MLELRDTILLDARQYGSQQRFEMSIFTRSPVSMTSACESGWSRIPAAMLVTQEIARTFDPHVARGDHFGDGRHSHQVGADAAQIFDFRGRFVAGAEQRGVDAFVQHDAQLGGLFARDLAIVARVGVRHVGKADAEAVVVRARPADSFPAD